jgi:hypothetical protein
MNPIKCSAIIAASLAVAAAGWISANAQARLFSPEAKQNAQALLKKMTLEEKIGQLNESSGMVMLALPRKSQTISLRKAALDRFSGR